MIKNYLRIALIVILIANTVGCAELRRKFVRKKEHRKEDASFYRIQEYGAKPPHESYQEHYMLWYNWHLDLERTDGTSRLRDINAANEALRHLTTMRDLLVEDKAKELDVRIEEMYEILARLKKRRRDIMEDTRSRKIIERLGRILINNFPYSRMKEYIKVDEGGEGK